MDTYKVAKVPDTEKHPSHPALGESAVYLKFVFDTPSDVVENPNVKLENRAATEDLKNGAVLVYVVGRKRTGPCNSEPFL